MSYSFYDKKYIPRQFGLNNMGSSCWFNSLIQTMLSISSFNKYMLENEETLSNASILAKEYIAFLKIMLTDEVKEQKYTQEELQNIASLQAKKAMDKLMMPSTVSVNNTKPTPLQLSSKPSKVTSYDNNQQTVSQTTTIKQQQVTAISNLSYVLLRALTVEVRKQRATLDIRSQEGVSNGFVVFLQALNHEPIYKLFNNRYEMYIPCKNCKKIVSVTSDKSCLINIVSDDPMTTEEEFVAYIKSHYTPHYDYTCENCGVKMGVTVRHYSLKMLREVIILVFNRVEHKNKWFPQTLTFTSKSDTKLVYKLVSQVEHSGNVNSRTYTSGGHWWAMCLRKDGQFYNLNDTCVSPGRYAPSNSTRVIVYHLDKEE